MSEKWKSASRASLQPAIGANGAINFIFGSGHLSIVCAVLQVCDIELEPGESVNGVNLGDRVRWQLEPAISGSGETQTQHLQIKPMDIGLKTTLVVTTSRRTYHMELRSHKTEYMPYVQFTYPENTIAKWEKFKKETEQAKQLATIPDTKTYLGDLDFNYEISGNASWKPLRVYNDGVKTIIQMPKKWQQNEAPTLLVIRENPGLFASDDEVLVNYRVQEDKYIVDDVFRRPCSLQVSEKSNPSIHFKNRFCNYTQKEQVMKHAKAMTFAWISTLITGCSSLPYGNFTQDLNAQNSHKIASDGAAQIGQHYPPAHTRLQIMQDVPKTDIFGSVNSFNFSDKMVLPLMKARTMRHPTATGEH